MERGVEWIACTQFHHSSSPQINNSKICLKKIFSRRFQTKFYFSDCEKIADFVKIVQIFPLWWYIFWVSSEIVKANPSCNAGVEEIKHGETVHFWTICVVIAVQSFY